MSLIRRIKNSDPCAVVKRWLHLGFTLVFIAVLALTTRRLDQEFYRSLRPEQVATLARVEQALTTLRHGDLVETKAGDLLLVEHRLGTTLYVRPQSDCAHIVAEPLDLLARRIVAIYRTSDPTWCKALKRFHGLPP